MPTEIKIWCNQFKWDISGNVYHIHNEWKEHKNKMEKQRKNQIIEWTEIRTLERLLYISNG